MRHFELPKIYGTTTVGERGQVVIPSAIRKKMKIESGDKLIVFTRHDKFIGLLKSDQLDDFLDKITSHVSEGLEKINKFKKELKRHSK